jgi:putative ubiquitin-RnfH superfamily antitoxin RatB of RatAB toxin-antitoxin module
MSQNIPVSIKEVGGFNDVVLVQAGATVRDALEVAGLSTEAKTIRLNNEDATLQTTLKANDLLYVVPSIKGNVA